MTRAWAAAVLVVTVLAAACSDSATTTTTTASTTTAVPIGADSPEEAVSLWLEALADADTEAITDLVRQDQLILLIAVDNVLEPGQIAQAIRSGISDDLRADYWRSFIEGFADFAGAALDDLRVREASGFAINEDVFAAVEIAYLSRIGSTEVVTAEVADGRWQVDLLATIGPSLVRPFRAILAALPPGEDGDLALGRMRDTVPSLRAALERPAAADLPVDFILETESLIRLLTSGG